MPFGGELRLLLEHGYLNYDVIGDDAFLGVYCPNCYTKLDKVIAVVDGREYEISRKELELMFFELMTVRPRSLKFLIRKVRRKLNES